MSPGPELLTPRLRLRPLGSADFPAFAAMSADAEAMHFIGAGGPQPADLAWRSLAMLIGHWTLRGYGQWALEERATGAFVGRAGLLYLEGFPEPEMAWMLARPHWGRGLAEEAVRATLQDAHTTHGIHRPISMIRAGNRRSQALAQRLGAQREGEIDFMGGPIEVWRHAARE